MRVHDCADGALLLELDASVGLPGERAVAAARTLREEGLPGVGACVPGLWSVLVEYDGLQVTRASVESALRAAAEQPLTIAAPPRRWVLPVCFDASFAPDLGSLAERCGLTPAEVVDLLCGTELRVAILGHLPGLPYLTGLPPQLDVPRRPSPRGAVAAGSVAVAAAMACVYPQRAPGGWHLVGRTAAALWDARRTPPALLLPGDAVRLEAQPAAPAGAPPRHAAPVRLRPDL